MCGETGAIAVLDVDAAERDAILDASVEQACECAGIAVSLDIAVESEVFDKRFRA